MKSQDTISRRINPDGRTRGCHARKRVAFGYKSAAFPRQISRFRGNPEAVGDAFSLRSCTGTLLPISPINTPAEQQRRGVQRQSQRAKSRV